MLNQKERHDEGCSVMFSSVVYSALVFKPEECDWQNLSQKLGR